ncbi:hypothetical protein HWV62_3869 [Athelia sp. TMB]|nr:hypothetical protein HWV62_3869 [Athelia sp. TMB]
MPLDGHSYLVAQGWSGKGTGLRQGAISRPLAIPQKKTLAGLGKDRDEAFPFWDHLFTAAANTIKIKVDSDDEDDSRESSLPTDLKRTSTGILSNRRPTTGRVLDSGATTPEVEAPRFSLLSNAKREAAKRGLYSRFFRGPILGPAGDEFERQSRPNTKPASERNSAASGSAVKSKGSEEDSEQRKERKRLRKERKEAKLLRKEARRVRKAQRLLEETQEKEKSSARKPFSQESGEEDQKALLDEIIHKSQKKRKDRSDEALDIAIKSDMHRDIRSALVADSAATRSPVRKRKRKREAFV